MTAVLLSLGLAAAIALATRASSRRERTPPRGPGLSRAFDSVFRTECPGIPVALLRALAKNESNFDPGNATGPAWGLLQVVEVLRRDYNARHGTNVARQQLLDPQVNVRIACDLISRIAASYVRNHPRVFPRIDWRDPRFVALVIFGWNAGYSEAAGVGHVLGQLEAQGADLDRIDIHLVHAAAITSPKAARFLRMAKRVAWTNKVVRDYVAELRREEANA